MKKRVTQPFDNEAAKAAVVAVGQHRGRGFVMEITEPNPLKEGFVLRGKFRRPPRFLRSRLVVTAAHCLPHLPPARANASEHEKTYSALLGPLGDAKPSVMAECLFVDAVADIAVLGEPDGQVFENADCAFREFIDATGVLPLSKRDIVEPVTGWLLSLDGRWTACTLAPRRFRAGSWISEATDGIVAGMSGSPILLEDGRAVGMVVVSDGSSTERHTEGGPQPLLTGCLPGWLLQVLGRTESRARSTRKRG